MYAYHSHLTTPPADSQGSRCRRLDNKTAVSRPAKELKGPRGWIKPISSCQSPQHIMTMWRFGYIGLCLFFLVFHWWNLIDASHRGVSVAPARPRFHKEFILKTTDLPETIFTCSTRTTQAPNINWSPIKQQKCIKLILAEQKHSAMDSWINTCRMDEQTGAGGEYGRTQVQVQMDGGKGQKMEIN